MSTTPGGAPVAKRRLSARIAAALGLGVIDNIGSGTTLGGRPYVANDGVITIGRDCLIGSRPIQSHFVVMPGAHILLGDRVVLSYGAALSALHGIEIGDDTRVGPFCVILDNDFHKVGDRNLPGLAAPVVIGRGVTIGARVTMLRGARIGDGAIVSSGSTISGVVAAGAVVSGVPARVVGAEPVRRADPAVAEIVRGVFGLRGAVSASDGPGAIPAWDGAGAMRLLLALETQFSITLSPERVRAAGSVAELSRLVLSARGPSASNAAPR